MPNGLFTPKLIMEVAEAGEDSVITHEEFSGIMKTIASVFMGVAMMVFITMLIRGLIKGTGVKTKKIAGIPLPVLS